MKIFLATFVGLIAAFLSLGVLELVGHQLFPIPFEIDITNPSGLREQIAMIPTSSLVSVIFAHGIGLLIGLVIARLIDKNTLIPLSIITLFILIGTIANLSMIPHPTWFMIADIAIIVIIGGGFIYLANKKAKTTH